MVNCAVYGCSNRSWRKNSENTNKVKFYGVPSVIYNQCSRTQELSERRRAEWFRRIRRADIDENSPNYKVCSVHFISGKPSYLMDERNPDWAPSLQLGYSTNPTDLAEGRSAKPQ
ncbi:uncharacterized protein LOC142576016 [Dermacentor variabilis]|uniref:uncharacterized protein LOC142576016 n=1 Tax=Dermacentor variabilis TaxID=34621 RepID=UPI003F5C7DC0